MRTGGVVVVALAACSGGETVVLSAPPGVKSVITIVGESDVHAYVATDPLRIPLPDRIAEGTPVIAIFYARTLDDLGLDPGPVKLAGPDQASRPIPVAELGALRMTFRVKPWSASPVPMLRLPVHEPARCVSRGGCFQGECVTPCPAVALPAQPASPRPPTPPRSPNPPAPLALTPCRAGWTSVTSTSGGPEICAPPDIPPTVTCAAEEAQRYGEAGCSAIGRACGQSEWGPESGAIYVRAGGRDGDGTMGSPYASLTSALANAPDGAIILLGKGGHTSPRRLERPVTLIGACSAESSIAGPLQVAARDVRIEHLATDAIDVLPGGEAELSGARVLGSIVLSAAELRATGSVLRGGLWGIRAASGSTAAIDGVVIEDMSADALRAEDRSVVRAHRVVVRRSRNHDVYFASPARMQVDGAHFESSGMASIRPQGGHLTLTDVAIYGSDASAEAMIISDGADVSGVGLQIANRRGCPISVNDSRLALVDVLLDGTMRGSADLVRAFHSSLELHRVRLVQGRGSAIALFDESELDASDVWLEAIDVIDEGGFSYAGYGLYLSAAARARVERMRVEDVYSALHVERPTTTATVSDLVAVDVKHSVLTARDGGRATIQRAAVVDARLEVLIVRDPGSSLTVEDLRTRSTNRHVSAMLVEDGALELTRAVLETPGPRGLHLVTAASTATVTDVVLGAAVLPDGDIDPFGVQNEGHLLLERVEIDGGYENAMLLYGPTRLVDVSLAGPLRGIIMTAPLSLDRVRLDRMSKAIEGSASIDARDLDVIGTGNDDELSLGGLVSIDRVRLVDGGIRLHGPTERMSRIADVEVRGPVNRGISAETSVALDRVLVNGAKTALHLHDGVISIRDLDVRGVREDPESIGLATINGGDVDVERFRISDVGGSAVEVRVGGLGLGIPSLDLAHGVIADSHVAVNLVFDAYDLRRLLNDVAFEGNERLFVGDQSF